MGAIRAFVCAAPPPEAAAEISGFIEALSAFKSFRWVKPEQIHVTLKFLGDITADRIQALDSNLSRIGGVSPFDVRAACVGAFPSPSNPRVLWLGVAEGADCLEKLASRVEKAAKASGCEAGKRKFQAHITLGRAKGADGAKGEGGAPQSLEEILGRAGRAGQTWQSGQAGPSPEFSWRCGSFILMKSVLTPQGPIYTPIREYPLA